MDGNTLFHYTSTDGLFGVMLNKEIWFTDYQFLNDKGEFKKALHTLTGRLRDSDYTTCSMMLEMLLHQIETQHSMCVCSFSGTSDSLTQWRFYGDDCRGSCIGFRSDVLKNNTSDSPSLTCSAHYFSGTLMLSETFKCSYDPLHNYIEETIFLFKELFDYLNAIDMQHQHEQQSVLEALAPHYKSSLFSLLKTLFAWKHHDFINEDESRAIALVPLNELSYRLNRNLITPYYKRTLEDVFSMESIKVIILGAKSDKRNSLAISSLTSQYGEQALLWEANARELSETRPETYEDVGQCARHKTQYN
ncbi:hypothetical protein RJ45_12510 [Photobacterium gaetbulicola]|uniref:DUF2971 domain-containing protein n=1 Tax=Photobacterium gaetbulicola TaxID=1295392 RepID=A0A0B9GES9_9GAMM|nr:DUF2971 domain-containing protein [Photobacterium gaetbulicola]KHT63235.1 hypothetical protein RJ45_12510 [Photobacterium gaetbulicola]